MQVPPRLPMGALACYFHMNVTSHISRLWAKGLVASHAKEQPARNNFDAPVVHHRHIMPPCPPSKHCGRPCAGFLPGTRSGPLAGQRSLARLLDLANLCLPRGSAIPHAVRSGARDRLMWLGTTNNARSTRPSQPATTTARQKGADHPAHTSTMAPQNSRSVGCHFDPF